MISNHNSNTRLNFRKRYLLLPTKAAVKTLDSNASSDEHTMINPSRYACFNGIFTFQITTLRGQHRLRLQGGG